MRETYFLGNKQFETRDLPTLAPVGEEVLIQVAAVEFVELTSTFITEEKDQLM